MAKWTAEKMVEELKGLLGTRLVSVVLYGSGAGGDHAGKNSDINLLVVTHRLQTKELLGPDPVEGLGVSHDHLRVELEHELQGKLLRLKTRSTLTEARPGLMEKLMVESLSTFLVLFKGALRLYGVQPPVNKMEALRKLKEHVAFDAEAFEVVDRLKRGEKIKNLDVAAAFEKYLGAIEDIVDNVV